MQRALFLYAGFPDLYGVFHVTDSHIGRAAPANPSGNLKSLMARSSEVKCSIVVVTGDLTDQGSPEQYKEFIRILNTCALPTFVCPGNHDRGDDNWARFFGPQAYYFMFGQDGYMAYDTKDFNTADEAGPQDGALYTCRRAIQSCRWAVGITHRYEANQGMRSQLTLFLDEPLDWLLFGHWHRENNDTEKTTPWGLTKLIVTPAAINGSYRIIEVSSRGLRGYPSQIL
jgi:3',5'-cyclic AMP phosphodiesterase CpdA